jgi:phosphatidylserine/phosphatidylglycerophosphate/cardiolipin synthase-like enzyme
MQLMLSPIRSMVARLRAMPQRRRRAIVTIISVLAALWVALFLYHVFKPLPPGVSFAGEIFHGDVEFLSDVTYRRDGEEVVEQTIFQRVLSMIDSADRFVVIDMFLFNDEHAGDRRYRPLTAQLTDRLIARKSQVPDVDITFISDPINNFYGAYSLAHFDRLRDAGSEVVLTRLTRLRDSNPLYSAGWRLFVRWFGTGGPGWVPHPLSSRGQRVTARSYLKLLNFKANHRKLLVTEDGCLLTSANPHDASSFHSNIAFVATGPICQEVLDTERNVAAFSRARVAAHSVGNPDTGARASPTRMQYLTEGRISAALQEEIGLTGPTDRIDVAVFYLSERSIIQSLIDAAGRGVDVRLVLDPNKDAFGREKDGIPNRQVAWELRQRSRERIGVRWYDTHGEQFHTKLALFTRGDSVTVIGGSANFTRRNIGDYNLEANLRVWTPRDSPFARQLTNYFERLWTNRDGHFTVDFDAYRDEAWLKRMLYRVQEFTGLCTY